MNNIYGGYYPFEINYEAEEKKRQKKSLKSTSNKVGLFVTAYFLSMYLISIVLGVLTGFGMISACNERQGKRRTYKNLGKTDNSYSRINVRNGRCHARKYCGNDI